MVFMCVINLIKNIFCVHADTVIAIVAVVISFATYIGQIKFNKQSIRPVVDIITGDYEGDVFVKIVNNGVGPAIIQSIDCIGLNGMRNSVLIDLIRTISDDLSDVVFSDFTEDIVNRTLPVNGEIVLVALNTEDEEIQMMLRRVLKDVTIDIQYKDIYEDSFYKNRKLDFYNRWFE